MPLPQEVRREVERALTKLGLGGQIVSAASVGGGCINNGVRLESDSGVSLFLKWNASAPAGMFEAEADGLRALAAAAPTLRVPAPLTWGGVPEHTAWLLLEFIPRGQASAATESALGRGLAEMHGRVASGGFGWEHDNYIGSLAQTNSTSSPWGAFWRDRRIEPQLSMARMSGLARDTDFDALLDVIPNSLADVTRPALVHGDLWSGNWFASQAGDPVIIDPATYRGHGEVDLAMSELFGGFGESFYDAYDEALGISSAYRAYRKDLYQLYYLLVHVNLFGSAYEAASLAAARRVLSEVG